MNNNNKDDIVCQTACDKSSPVLAAEDKLSDFELEKGPDSDYVSQNSDAPCVSPTINQTPIFYEQDQILSQMLLDHTYKMYQNQMQTALQNPNIGPAFWPGGFHPQHTHSLTYAKLFIGGINRKSTRKSLSNYFSNFGPIQRIDLVMDPSNPKQNKGFAFVQFEGISGCENACSYGRFQMIDWFGLFFMLSLSNYRNL